MAASPITLYPLNDFFAKARLRSVNPATGVETPLTSGTVTAFLATSSGPTATAADPALSMSPVHLVDGVWLIFFDAAVLTTALLDPLFGTSAPYLIVQQPGGVRVYTPVTYTTARPAELGYL